MRPRSIMLPIASLPLVLAAAAMPLSAHAQDRKLEAAALRISAGGNSTKTRTAHVLVSLRSAVQRGTISGQVVLPSGLPPNNRLRITLNGYRISSLIAYTDNKGRFVIPNIGDGTYTLEVEGDPNLYEAVSQEVRLIYGAHAGLVITLREKKQPAIRSTSNVVSTGEFEQQVPDEARKEFEKGAEFSEKGKIDDAIKRFKNAVKIYPKYLMARNNLGAQYLKLGQWREAAEQFEVAIEVDAKALNPRQNISIALIEQKKYVEAIEHLNHALAIDSSSPTTHLYAGIASIGVDEIDQAARELSLALSLGGAQYANAHFYMALVHMKKGERDAAKRELTAYLENMPKGEKAPRARELIEKLK